MNGRMGIVKVLSAPRFQAQVNEAPGVRIIRRYGRNLSIHVTFEGRTA